MVDGVAATPRLERSEVGPSNIEGILVVDWLGPEDVRLASLEIRQGSCTRKRSAFGAKKIKSDWDGTSWDTGWLEDGFVLKWIVLSGAAQMAEVQVELEGAHWYGGGHLMTQHWPLERAMWEVGPYLPFDNGPNGINTLIHPVWLNSRGLAVVAQEDTPYLHVGFNAPQTRRERQWAVGVQNALQPLLPKADDGSGDGLLRLQRRSSYQDPQMQHPLAHFGGSPIERFFGVDKIPSDEEVAKFARLVSEHLLKVRPFRDIIIGLRGGKATDIPYEQLELERNIQGLLQELVDSTGRAAEGLEQRVREAAAAMEELLDLSIYRAPLPARAFNRGRDDAAVLGELLTDHIQDSLRSALPAAPGTVRGSTPAWASSRTPRYLSVQVCLAAYEHVRAASEAVLRTLPTPLRAPPAALWKRPIWTTWARYKADVDQRICERFALEILDAGFEPGVLEIDDRWQECYGDAHFDPTKFPDSAGMVRRLHDQGFQVTVWVMPFLEAKSEAYREARELGFLIRQSAAPDSEPAMVQTWLQPRVAVLDVTNPNAVDWFADRLRSLQNDVGLDGFKFDAGEPCFLPFGCHTHRPLRHPAEFTHLYITRLASQFPFGEMRSGYLTQHVPMFTRMGDKFSSFGLENGLASLIPTLLTSGLLGYPFVLPDMVGGNAYFLDLPTKELVVRWAQANALMPAIQFSIAPWNLRDGAWWLARLLDWFLHPFRDTDAEAKETLNCVLEAMKLRNGLREIILPLMGQAALTLEPVCRPLWWASPEDPNTFTIADEFLLGDSILVAPQLQDGARQRDVYLPRGCWRRLDAAGAGVAESGPRWLRGVATELDTVLVFELVP